MVVNSIVAVLLAVRDLINEATDASFESEGPRRGEVLRGFQITRAGEDLSSKFKSK